MAWGFRLGTLPLRIFLPRARRRIQFHVIRNRRLILVELPAVALWKLGVDLDPASPPGFGKMRPDSTLTEVGSHRQVSLRRPCVLAVLIHMQGKYVQDVARGGLAWAAFTGNQMQPLPFVTGRSHNFTLPAVLEPGRRFAPEPAWVAYRGVSRCRRPVPAPRTPVACNSGFCGGGRNYRDLRKSDRSRGRGIAGREVGVVLASLSPFVVARAALSLVGGCGFWLSGVGI